MSDKDVTQDFVADFLDELDVPAGNPNAGDFTRVRLYPAYLAKVPDGNSAHFGVHEFGKEGARQAANDHLLKHDVEENNENWPPHKRNPVACVVFRRYRDDFLNRTMRWENDQWETRYVRQDSLNFVHDDEGDWGLFVYSMVEASWATVEYDKNWRQVSRDRDAAPLMSRWNTDLWAHVLNLPDPTFDEENEDTWNPPYNCYENKGHDEVDLDSREYKVQFYPVLRAAFDTKDELLAYIEENGIEFKTTINSDEADFSSVKVSKKVVAWLESLNFSEALWADDDYALAREIHAYVHKHNGNIKKTQGHFNDAPAKMIKAIYDIPAF